MLCVPTALVNNIGGLLFLRFLQGFFGSPCLANGGATMQDMVCITRSSVCQADVFSTPSSICPSLCLSGFLPFSLLLLWGL